MERGRSRLALVAEEPLEPAVAQDRVVAGALVAGLGELGGELAQRDSLLVLVALDRVRDSGEVGRELVLVAQEVAPALVELRGRVGLDVAELVTVAVLGHDRELRLSRTQGHLLALERHALGQDRVLELVLALGELLVGHTALAGEAQPRDPLPLVAVGTFFRGAQRVELLAAEEVAVARDDLRPLRDLLLAHADRAHFLRSARRDRCEDAPRTPQGCERSPRSLHGNIHASLEYLNEYR